MKHFIYEKKTLAWLCAAIMLLSLLPMSGFALRSAEESESIIEEEPTEVPADGEAPQVGTVTVTLTLSDEAGASFAGGAKTTTIQVYVGGYLNIADDPTGQLSVCSNYGGLNYFYAPLTVEAGYVANYVPGQPGGGIIEAGTYEVEIVRAYSMTINTNADNRGAIAKGEVNNFVPTSELVNMKFYQGGTLKLKDYEDESSVIHTNAMVAYDYKGLLGDGFYPGAQTGYQFDHWEGLPADGIVNSDLVLTAWFVPIAEISTAEQTSASVSDGVAQSVANSADMSKASVTGVNEALDDQIVEFLMSEGVGLSEEDANNSATQVDIETTVNVTLTEGSTNSLSFSVKPSATVTKNGATLAEGAAVPNEYLNKTMTVTIPCGDVVPTSIEHRSSNGTLIETFTQNGSPAFTYDAASKTVTMEISQFSYLNITGTAAPTATAVPTAAAAPVKKAPGTGDNNALGLWIAMASVSVIATGAVLTINRKEN